MSNFVRSYGVRVVNTLGTQLFVQSGTYWDDRTLNRTIHLDANSHWTDNALWITRMAQFGQGLMKDAQVTPPGVAIFWPATFAGGTAYSPVARIILDGSLWVTADPLVHEYGHNVRYVTGVPWYFYNCLGAFLPCDPGFAALVGGYNHSPASSIPAQVAQNEGFAEYFYEMVKIVNPTQSRQNYTTPYPIPTNPGNWGQNIFRDCSTSNSCGFWSIPSGMTNEARVSSFFYRYTNEVLSCADGSKSDVAKFNRFMTGMMNTVVGELSQSVIGLWNNNLYRSFPTASYCPNEPDLTARRAKLKQILTDTTIATLVGTSYQGSTGEVVLIP